MSKAFNLHVPITKVDEEQRMVWGVATSEAVDSQNDIVDFEASKAAFSTWLGNIREMHQPIAVGKAIDVQFDDEKKEVMIGAKISESIDGEQAWIKVKENILTGFSIGGNVNKVIKETAKVNGSDVSVTRIMDYELSETSLVDNPSNPDAMFVMVKSQKGGLQRVEHEATDSELKKVIMPGWYMQFTPPIEKAQALYNNSKGVNQMAKKQEIKKGLWDASFLLDLAIELGYYINGEQYEGEDVADLQTALDTIKAAVVKELSEPNVELTTAVELAQKVTTLKKGKDVKKSVVGSEDRDENAKVVVTAEENGRPVNDTEERAAAAGVPVKGSEEPEVEAEPEEEEKPAEEPAAPEEPAKPEKPAEKPAEKKVEVKGGEAEKPAEPEAPAKPEAPAEPDEEEAAKAVTVGDLHKFTDGLLNKLGDNNKEQLSKVLGEFSDKVDEQFALLKGRLSKLEDQPAAPKAKASYVTVEKGKESGDSEEADVAAMLKRRDELAANPNLGDPKERMELAQALRKAQAAGAVIA